MQLEFDLWVPVAREDPDVLLTCSFCGEQSGRYAYILNHAPINGVWSKAWLFKNHCASIEKDVPRDPGTPGNCYAEGCTIHYLGEYVRKLPEACLRLEYDEKRAWLARCGVKIEELKSV